MAVARLSAILRISLGVALVGFALGAGLLQRSPWILPFMGVGFTAAYLFGQLRLWRAARNTGKLKLYWMQLPADFGVQLVLVSVLYLVGFGLSALVSGGVSVDPFAPGDAIWPLAAGAAASILGLYADRIEGRPSTYFPAWMMGKADDADGIRILPAPVTVDSFFAAPARVSEPSYFNKAPEGPEDLSGLPGLTDDDITRLEARLGRALPDTLIALYQRRNGGPVNGVCTLREGVETASQHDDILQPFGISGGLLAADEIMTVWDAIDEAAAYSAAPGEVIRAPEDRARVVICGYGLEMLFLDYNLPGPPRVGLRDFDRYDLEGEPDPGVWWPDFETFFAALRHFEPV